MGTITVRNLDPEVQRLLKQRAAAHDRSMEAEVREILAAAVRTSSFAADWIASADEFRAEFVGVDLELPERSLPREIEIP
ncbi:FitA-like ribbon-helix-helix domain-containing protein [Nocardioides marmorisolisilvae]|uniref:Plasmid stabilization protein n=1 Tax=Nocardioides marmorisolisilvae TaxID=1542737 RepID=A0A3N0DZB1_9ACTN|nr:plasmid stabilization protein [Nocardioides marmorisolisilvae]RNL80823.1 plasmid stabilization protein [Nocardioides marmorisolisilvae]